MSTRPTYGDGWLPPGPPPQQGLPGSDRPDIPGQQPPERQPSTLRRLLGPLVVAAALLLKFGKPALLLLTKAKFLTTSLSMLVSIAAYSVIWGWRFAVGFVVLLLVHELGHVIQLKREGIEATAPLFIPFLGAAVGMKRLPDDAAAEARVGLAGPILGTLGTAALVPVAIGIDSDLLRAIAFTGFFLNLFNLVPVSPLDGGRAFAAMAPWMWFVGLFALLVMAFAWPNPIIVLIVLIGAFDTWRRWKQYRAGGEEVQRYYRVKPRTRWLVGLTYLVVAAGCVLGMDATFIERDFDDV